MAMFSAAFCIGFFVDVSGLFFSVPEPGRPKIPKVKVFWDIGTKRPETVLGLWDELKIRPSLLIFLVVSVLERRANLLPFSIDSGFGDFFGLHKRFQKAVKSASLRGAKESSARTERQ